VKIKTLKKIWEKIGTIIPKIKDEKIFSCIILLAFGKIFKNIF